MILITVVAALIISPAAARPAWQEPATATSPAVAQPETVESLQSRITAVVAHPRYGSAAWGIKIVSLDTGKLIFAHNAEKYFSPASNAKLYTGALALARLGPDFRIRTSLYSAARPDATGTLKGDLLIYGRGDPTMAARLYGGNYAAGLEPLVERVAASGVRHVEGDLLADDSYFKGPPFGSGWQWDDLQAYYGAEVSALTINDNSLDLFVKPGARAGIPCQVTTGPVTSYVTIMNRTQTGPKGSESRISIYRPVGENIIYVSGRLPIDAAGPGYQGSVAVHNPAGLFAALFKDALARRGITVKGRARVIDWKYREVTPVDFSKLIELGFVESLPAKDIIREMMKPSQNLYAQLLLLQVGAARAYAAEAIETRASTETIGLNAMTEFLSEVGVKKGDVLLEEGSGLSRADLITPNATVDLLKFMRGHKWADDYQASLPVAGVDGTLQNRMKGTVAAGNLRAKTGTLRYVNTLSGYVTTAAGERLAFSIMLNNYYNSDRGVSPREDIDSIAVMLAGFTGKSQ
jgi:D-alanyl-D-alanine carboxypeptidase/D-alanyl-D-alanine-endopeptidase (penicillin-binding protein 4)